jgi:hypothetical protein
MRQRSPLLCLALLTACQGDVQVVEVKTPPTAEINTPGSNAQTFPAGDLVTFEGVVQDQQDAPDRLTATWTSDRDGALEEAIPDANGRVTFATVDLSEGVHVVTLQVVDTDGEIGEDSVSLQVARVNSAPDVVIDTPTSGDSFVEGANITFVASASDPDDEDPPESLDAIWETDSGEVLGNDAPDASGGLVLNTSSLALGSHMVTVTVTDSMGASAVDQVYIEIVEANEPPQVMISSPLSGDEVLEGSIAFSGEATDGEERADYLAINWVSSIDGVFNWDPASSTGQLGFNTSALSIGDHTITLSAEDSGGLSATDSIRLEVVAADDWDADGDGWTPNEGDCDDGDPAISPGAAELCDAIDNDCDGEINEGQGDSYEPNDTVAEDLGSMDGDGFCMYYVGYVSGSADQQTIFGTLHSPDDVDLYSFDTTDDIADCLDEPGYGIQISLSSIPSGHDYGIELYWVDDGYALVASSDNSGSADEYLSYEGTYTLTSDSDDSGTYEIVVSPSAGSGYGCGDSYQLEVVVW